MVVTSKHRTHKVMEAAIRELMGAGTPPRFKFKDTYASIEFPSGYTIPAQATLEAKYDELLALEEGIQKTVMEGDLEVGTSNLFVDTQTGNIGIGTNSPIGALDINAGPENDTTPALAIRGGIYDESDLYVLNSYNVNTGVGYAAKVIGVNIKNKVETNNTVKIRDNQGGLTSAGAIYLGSDDINQGIFGVLGADGTAGTTLSEHLTVRAGGNVGIGTTSPLNLLHLSSDNTSLDASGSATFDEYSLIIHNTRGSVSNNTELGLCFNHYDTNYPSSSRTPGAAITHERIDSWSKGKLHFKTKSGNTEAASCDTRMTIDAGGNVGIGTNSPMTTGLHIANSYFASGGNTDHFNPQIFITGDSGTGGNQVSAIGFSGNSSGDTHQRMVAGSVYYKGGGGNYGMDGYLGIAVANSSTGGADPYGLTEGELESHTRIAIKNNGNVGIGTNNPGYKLEVNGTMRHNGLSMSSGTTVDQLTTIEKSLTITAAWMDTGIKATNLATGTYIVQIYNVSDHGSGGSNYEETYSGIMSWFAGNTNSTEATEIPLTAAGHAPNDNHIYLRVMRTVSADTNNLKLQIRKDTSMSSAYTYTFEFRRMI